MRHELETLFRHGVAENVSSTPWCSRVHPVKWLFRYEFDSGGDIVGHTARLAVSGGDSNLGFYDIDDYKRVDTWKPESFTAFRLIIELAAENDMYLHRVTLSNAYLNTTLSEEVFIEFPPHLRPQTGCKALRLHRAIPGLPTGVPVQKHRQTTLGMLGFVPLAYGGVFVRRDYLGGPETILYCYYDDIVIASATEEMAREVVSTLQPLWKSLTDRGPATSFLDITITRNRAAKTITLTQPAAVRLLSSRFPQHVQFPAGMDAKQLALLHDRTSYHQPNYRQYRETVSRLFSITQSTEPRASSLIAKLAQYKEGNLTREAWYLALQAISWIGETQTKSGLVLGGHPHPSPVVGYSRGEVTAGPDGRAAFRGGYVVQLFGSYVNWHTFPCDGVSRVDDAEMLARAKCAEMVVYVRGILKALGCLHLVRSPSWLIVGNGHLGEADFNPFGVSRIRGTKLAWETVNKYVQKSEVAVHHAPGGTPAPTSSAPLPFMTLPSMLPSMAPLMFSSLPPTTSYIPQMTSFMPPMPPMPGDFPLPTTTQQPSAVPVLPQSPSFFTSPSGVATPIIVPGPLPRTPTPPSRPQPCRPKSPHHPGKVNASGAVLYDIPQREGCICNRCGAIASLPSEPFRFTAHSPHMCINNNLYS